MSDYAYFSYEVNEALHISERERRIVLDCFSMIEHELERGVDTHGKKLITYSIELLLNYCVRFYDRQFMTRDHMHRGILEKFERLLDDYLQSEKPQENGLPTVAYFAGQLHLSANYFGDLILVAVPSFFRASFLPACRRVPILCSQSKGYRMRKSLPPVSWVGRTTYGPEPGVVRSAENGHLTAGKMSGVDYFRPHKGNSRLRLACCP